MPLRFRGDMYCSRFLCGVEGVMVGGSMAAELVGGVRDLESSWEFPERDGPGTPRSGDPFVGVAFGIEPSSNSSARSSVL